MLDRTRCWAGLVLALWFVGCTAPVGSHLRVPPDAAEECAQHCATIGMRLSAVAIMASNVGCVCQPGPEPETASTGDYTAATTGGMATILMQQRAQQQQQAQQQQAQRSSAY
jgi:hypothetical protein